MNYYISNITKYPKAHLVGIIAGAVIGTLSNIFLLGLIG